MEFLYKNPKIDKSRAKMRVIVEFFDSRIMKNNKEPGFIIEEFVNNNGEKMVRVELYNKKIVLVPSEFVSFDS